MEKIYYFIGIHPVQGPTIKKLVYAPTDINMEVEYHKDDFEVYIQDNNNEELDEWNQRFGNSAAIYSEEEFKLIQKFTL